MLSFPLPLIVALLLGFWAIKALFDRSMSSVLLLLLFFCALQNLIVTLSVHYGLPFFRMIQPMTGAIIPPLAFVAFQDNVLRRIKPVEILPHLTGPILVVLCVAFAPDAIDPALISLFVLYAFLILVPIFQRKQELPRARLDAGELPRVIWLGIGLNLLLSASLDLAIAFALADGQFWLRPILITVSSSVALLGIGGLSLSPSLGRFSSEAYQSENRPAEDVKPDSENARDLAPGSEQNTSQDAELIGRLEGLLMEEKLYLDPDLTLARLARRLSVPAKLLSAAVNRSSGENVSRYINAYRVRHACAALAAGATVTSAMLNSGFNTKSNFNREFLRVTGVTPSDWKAGEQG
ncbi:MAG: helix-turn-helix transcriptional regulator [Rhodobacteraceae bacterium]|nr:helix-turn-helix transcriptional regulator [Paracoccaceae bacterium]